MVLGADQLPTEPQLRARRFLVDIDHPIAGRLTYPGAPFKMSENTWRAGRAPLLGEHNQEIYCSLLGYTTQDLRQLKDMGVV